jgi:phospholipid/cholesterol/gamma-HCH transport system substrate-binding protein
MEPEARYTVVGTAVLLLLGVMVAAVLWLRSNGEGRDDRHYKIYFERQSLEGLEVRSDVRMRGIRVGSVTGFLFSSRRRGAVEVTIRVDGSTPVRQSTQAIVERHLVTGIASIRLVNATEESPPLTQPPADEPYPVIAEGESPIQQFSESINQLAQRADETMQGINATLSPANQAALSEILENLRRVSENANTTLAQVDKTLVAMSGAAGEVGSLSRGLQAESTTAMREVAAAVRQMREDVAQLSRQADALLASSDAELRSTAQSLRSAADALGAAADKLGDPRSVLFGPAPGALGPGEGAR